MLSGCMAARPTWFVGLRSPRTRAELGLASTAPPPSPSPRRPSARSHTSDWLWGNRWQFIKNYEKPNFGVFVLNLKIEQQKKDCAMKTDCLINSRQKYSRPKKKKKKASEDSYYGAIMCFKKDLSGLLSKKNVLKKEESGHSRSNKNSFHTSPSPHSLFCFTLVPV